MSKLIHIFPYPCMNCSVSSRNCIAGFHYFSLLQNIIRYKKSAFSKDSLNIRKIINILSLGSIHEYEIIWTFQSLQHFQRISLYKCYNILFSCPFKIISCHRYSLIIILYCSNCAFFRHILTHKNR